MYQVKVWTILTILILFLPDSASYCGEEGYVAFLWLFVFGIQQKMFFFPPLDGNHCLRSRIKN